MADKVVIPGSDGQSADSAGADQSRRRFGWDLLFDFHAMIENLEATDGIVEVDARLYDPVANFTIETIEHGLGIQIPARIKSFYEVSDGLEFQWSYRRDGEVVPGGGAHLFDFATVFGHWLDSLWQTGAADEADFLWSLRGFDRGCQPGLQQMVVVCVEEQYPTYDLFIHQLNDHTSDLLELTFRQYFDYLLASRGTFGWRRLLSDNAHDGSAEAQTFFELMGRFFPDVDLQPWRVHSTR